MNLNTLVLTFSRPSSYLKQFDQTRSNHSSRAYISHAGSSGSNDLQQKRQTQALYGGYSHQKSLTVRKVVMCIKHRCACSWLEILNPIVLCKRAR